MHTSGRDFPFQDPFPLAIDRQTGARPNPSLGAPGGYYVTSTQTMDYNALQTSFRKRFSNRYSYDVAYTLAKGMATQGGDLAAYYLASVGNTQDFWNPEGDRAPVDNDIRHRVTLSGIYELPNVNGGREWSTASSEDGSCSPSSPSMRTTLSVAQSSGITQSRPDIVAGVDPVLDNWQHTNVYQNTAAFVSSGQHRDQCNASSGTYLPGMVIGPGKPHGEHDAGQNFGLVRATRLQIRVDAFNVFNTKNLNNPTNGITASNFGVITGARVREQRRWAPVHVLETRRSTKVHRRSTKLFVGLKTRKVHEGPQKIHEAFSWVFVPSDLRVLRATSR
jgi:hypothetical protein